MDIDSLVICTSISGNTVETLSILEKANKIGWQKLIIRVTKAKPNISCGGVLTAGQNSKKKLPSKEV